MTLKMNIEINDGIFYQPGTNIILGKNFSTPLNKGRFIPFTLNENNQLVIYLQEPRHPSEIDAQSPIIAAGGLQFNDKGQLERVSLESHLYKTTIASALKLIDYFQEKDVSLNHVQLVTSTPLSQSMSDVKSEPGVDEEYYLTPLHQIYTGLNNITQNVNAAERLLEAQLDVTNKSVTSIQAQLIDYQTGFFSKIRHYINKIFNSELTPKRLEKAIEFNEIINTFQTNLNNQPDTNACIKQTLMQISTLENANNNLSTSYGKEESSGQLAKKISGFKKQLLELKTDTTLQAIKDEDNKIITPRSS